jgi:hypothetical protein
MIASTSKMWMNPPKVYELTIPSNQRTRSITAMVQSIVNPFRARAIFDQPFSFHRLFEGRHREYRVDYVSQGRSALINLAENKAVG